MKLETLTARLTRTSWTQDNYGHFQKTINGKKYRVKVQAISVRVEVQVVYAATEYSPARKEWVKITGAYLKDVKLLDKGVKIGTRCIC